MKKYIFILLISTLAVACGTKKKVGEQTPKETIDSITENKNIYIHSYVNGYGPLEVEKQVTIPLEYILKAIDNVISIHSISEDEYSKIIVSFNSNLSTDEALLIVQNKINELNSKNELPIVDNHKINPKVSDRDNFNEKGLSLEIGNTIEGSEISETDDIVTLEAFNHLIFNDLLKKYVNSNGKVDYKGFKNDKEALNVYIALLGEFMPTQDWSKHDKLAYWINAYNALTIDLILRNYPIKSIKDIKNPWEQRLWKLGGKWYNLNDIEHQILRKMDEPRIHFAIVCASVSCPKLVNEAYTAQTIEQQLSEATNDFLSDPNRNNLSENRLELSKIFQWFSKDFKQNGTLIDFLNQFSEIEISSEAKIFYKDYNWGLNE